MAIIIGYQGIGKSTMCKKNSDCVDLESSNFWFKDNNGNPKRWDNWADIYGNIAEHLSSQGNVVCVSSHFALRKRLKDTKQDVFIVVPSLELKDRWVKRLYYRYLETLLDKDYKAWQNAGEMYEQNITELINDAKENKWKIIIIDDMDNYDLYVEICYKLGEE